MDPVTLRAFLGWCSLLNFGLLLLWAIFLVAAPDLVHRTQTKWVSISREQFNLVMYGFLGLFKIFVLVFNVIPYLALRFFV